MSSIKRIKLDRNSDEIKSFNTFINKLYYENNQFKAKLLNSQEFVYEECNDLRRKVQLDTEETISRIKISYQIDINEEKFDKSSEISNKLIDINKFNQQMILEIDEYEKMLKNKNLDLNSLKKQIKSRDIFLAFILSNWTLNECENDINKLKLNNLMHKLNNLSDELNNDINNFEQILFNEIHLSYKNNRNESNLNAFNRYSLGHLLKTTSIDLLKMNRISTIGLFKDINGIGKFKSAKVEKIIIEILKNDCALIGFLSGSTTLIVLFDPIKKKIIENLRLKIDFEIQRINASQNLIAIECKNFNKIKSTFLIIDYSLNIIFKKELNFNLIGNSDFHLYLMSKEPVCCAFDWSLNELNKRVKFQQIKSSETFYLFKYEISRLRRNSFLNQFDHIKNRYIVRTNAYFLKDSFIIIYNEFGCLLNEIKLDQNDSDFKINHEEEILFIMERNFSQINVFNLDGLNLKAIKLINYDCAFVNSYVSHFFLWQKDKFFFLNFKNLIF